MHSQHKILHYLILSVHNYAFSSQVLPGGDGGAGIGSGSDVEATEIKVTGGVVKKATGGTDAAGVGNYYVIAFQITQAL